MKKPDEHLLWDAFPFKVAVFPRDAGHILGIPPKRVCSLCKKWSKQGVYDYGVTIDLGWKVDCGK